MKHRLGTYPKGLGFRVKPYTLTGFSGSGRGSWLTSTLHVDGVTSGIDANRI